MILNEIFDSTVKIDWFSKGKGRFSVDGIPFVIMFSEHEPSYWEVLFMIDPDYADRMKMRICGNTGASGYASMRVMSTVVNAIEWFIKLKKPNILEFSGAKDNGKSQLYTRMINSISLKNKLKQYGYYTDAVSSDMGTIYQIVRNGKDSRFPEEDD